MTSTTNQQQAQSGELLQFPRAHLQALTTVKVVIPCYNEAERLDTTAFTAFLSDCRNVDFVFVNDGSSDATLEVLQEIHAAFPDRVDILSLSRNSGKAEAVRQGLLHAAGSDAALVGYWDADLATPLEAIEDFARVGARYGDVEVIYGARRKLLGHRVNRTIPRRAVSRICAGMARLAVRLPIGDTQCGAKLIRNTPRLARALETPFSAGWLFDVELFTRLSTHYRKNGAAFYEYPLAEWTEVAGSKVSGRAILRSGLSMLRLIAESRLGLPHADVRGEGPETRVIRIASAVAEAA
jgi:glycosyltransferase involved in cell wall biosynthesis